jgi:site-specific DNA recombinase
MSKSNGHASKASPGEGERIALYLRVSSEEQRDKQTILTQLAELEQYCERHGYEVRESYADDGISGTIPLHKRPEGRRLLEDAREGTFDTVLVYRLDRLGRAQLVILDAADRLEHLGVALRSATEPYETATPAGRFMFQMLGSFAEFERESIRERTRAGLHRAFRDGKPMGVIPYGYRVASDADGQFVVEPEEAAVVREIFVNVAEGSTPYAEAKRLNALGVDPPGWRYRSGKWAPKEDGKRKAARGWTPEAVSNIVRQRAYSGTHEVRINGGESCIERAVTPILENRGIQERAVAALATSANARRRNREGDRRYLLAGLVRCAQCGYGCSGHATWSKGKRYSYYSCITNRRGKVPALESHGAPYIRAEWLEDAIWSDVKRFLENPGQVLERIREQMGTDDGAAELETRCGDLSRRLAAKRSEKDRYVKLYARGHLSEEELDLHLADLRTTTDNLALLLDAARAELAERRARAKLADSAEAWLLRLRESVSEVEGDTEEAYLARRQLVRLLVASIMVGRGPDGEPEVRVTYRFGEPPTESGEEVFVRGEENGKAFQVTTSGGDTHTFDSFECAIHALAPTCEYCGIKVIGHGVEADGRFYCCAHCASMAGVEGVADRA